jgi:hypothetical protein
MLIFHCNKLARFDQKIYKIPIQDLPYLCLLVSSLAHETRPKMFTRDKHTSLLIQSARYRGVEGLNFRTQWAKAFVSVSSLYHTSLILSDKAEAYRSEAR